MFIKIPKYYINTDSWTEEEKKSRPFIILNTKYIVSVNPLIVNYGEREVYYVEVIAINGKNFQFGFLNKKTADKYIDLIQTSGMNMVIE